VLTDVAFSVQNQGELYVAGHLRTCEIVYAEQVRRLLAVKALPTKEKRKITVGFVSFMRDVIDGLGQGALRTAQMDLVSDA
jgi:hypothetical protein